MRGFVIRSMYDSLKMDINFYFERGRWMKKVLVLACAFVFVAAVAFAAGPKTYQVTGPVVEVTETKIVVTKGEDNWQLARDANTKVTGDLKVGAKVMIEYTMTAASVEVKETGKKSKSR